MAVSQTTQGRRVLPSLIPLEPVDCRSAEIMRDKAARWMRTHRIRMEDPEYRERWRSDAARRHRERMEDPETRARFLERCRENSRERYRRDMADPEKRAAANLKARERYHSRERAKRVVIATEARKAQQREYHWAHREARLEIMRRWRAKQRAIKASLAAR